MRYRLYALIAVLAVPLAALAADRYAPETMQTVEREASCRWQEWTTTDKAARCGEEKVASAYCQRREDAERLTVALGTKGPEGYIEIMLDPAVRCVDSNIHPQVQPARVFLVYRGWSLTMDNEPGETMEIDFWYAEDVNGQGGWVWFRDVPSHH